MIGGPGFAAAVFARDLAIVAVIVALAIVAAVASGWGAFALCQHIWGAVQ